MKNIFNLIIYVVIIYLLVQLSNNLQKTSEKKFINDIEHFSEKQVVKENQIIYFDYDTVSSEEPNEPIQDRYQKELNSGSIVNPQYTNNTFSDQRAIYNNDMYAKQIHNDRTVDSINKTIAQVFDDSITDFKKLTPTKDYKTGDYLIQGGSNLSTFNIDDFVYDDEKPENGGVFGKDDKYNGNLKIYPFDNMLSLNNASF